MKIVRLTNSVLLGLSLAVASRLMAQPPDARTSLRFEDITDQVGLGSDVIGTTVARGLFVDADGDGQPDVVIQSLIAPPGVQHDAAPAGVHWPRLFLKMADSSTALGFRYVEVGRTGLPMLYAGDCLVFADMNNDGHADAIVTRYIDSNNESWIDHGQRTAWLPGHGDGTFGAGIAIEAAPPATTAAIAIGDADRDGRLDLYLGNWYTQYGPSLAAFDNDLLLQTETGNFERVRWSTDGHVFADEDADDRGGRPTYGAMIADVLSSPTGTHRPLPEIIELSYGRRWNRLYQWNPMMLSSQPPDLKPGLQYPAWDEIAPRLGFDGDSIRHGRYPEWLKERAKTDARFDREDEKPFRANGNTFDCAVGDVDNDGDWDLFLAEIAHGWAGESSDRSRFLINNGKSGDETHFDPDPARSVDRIPEGVNNWNQGDLFAELADFDLDGRLDLLLSSGDYPDDQRLRLFAQRANGLLKNVTEQVQLDHDGSQQISLSDVDGDGSLDVLVGQTFNRFTAEQREGREPRLRLFRSVPPVGSHSIEIRLRGDESRGVSRDALGAIVKVRVGDMTMQRQLIGIGGHNGKQHDLLIHFGLGSAVLVDEIAVVWPDAAGSEQRFADVSAGRYELKQGEVPELMR